MAKSKTIVHTLSEIIPLHRIGWLPEMNYRQIYEDNAKDLADLIRGFEIEGQWKDDRPIMAVHATPEMVKRIMDMRNEKWSILRSDPSQAGLAKLKTWESIYVDPKGKLLPADLAGNTGFRRSYNLDHIQEALVKRGKPIISELPVVIKAYPDEQSRKVDQLRENELHKLGHRDPSLNEKFNVALFMFNNMANQSALREEFLDGNGQKLYAACVLNARMPELKIAERINAFGKPGFIDLSKCEMKSLTRLAHGSRDKTFLPETDPEIVNTFLSDPKKDGVQAKSMGRPDIEAAIARLQWRGARFILKAVLDNSKDALTSLVKSADAQNLSWDLDRAGWHDQMYNVLLPVWQQMKAEAADKVAAAGSIAQSAGIAP